MSVIFVNIYLFEEISMNKLCSHLSYIGYTYKNVENKLVDVAVVFILSCNNNLLH